MLVGELYENYNSLTKPPRITFLRVILVLVDFSKSNFRLRKVILGSARMSVFSLTCEKSNSRTTENFIFLTCRTQFECPAARTAARPPGRTAGRPNGRTARLTAPDGPPNGPDGPPNGSARRSRRPSAPAVQPNQTKNNDTPTIASLGYTGPSYISDWGRIYNSRRFCQRKCNSHDIEIYWILYKCEKSISRSKENCSQRELLSFFSWQR